MPKVRAGFVVASALGWACIGVSETTLPNEQVSRRGTLVVSSMTTGVSPDPDGYWVTLDEDRGRRIGVNETVTFDTLLPRTYSVLLSDVAPTCAVTTANPVDVAVFADSAADHQFDVMCN